MSWFHIGPINSAMFILSFRNQDPITFHGQSTAHQGNVLALLEFFFFFGLLLMIFSNTSLESNSKRGRDILISQGNHPYN